MENKETKKYMVMSKFTHSDRFMLEKQFINKHSADYYVNARTLGARNVGIDPVEKYSNDAYNLDQ